jgi:hypothetical protein
MTPIRIGLAGLFSGSARDCFGNARPDTAMPIAIVKAVPQWMSFFIICFFIAFFFNES